MIKIVDLNPQKLDIYRLRIDAFIPDAVSHVDHTVFKSGEVNGIRRLYSVEEYRARWSKCYLTKMNELTMGAGLRIPMLKKA